MRDVAILLSLQTEQFETKEVDFRVQWKRRIGRDGVEV